MFTFHTFPLIINILEAFIVKTNNNIKIYNYRGILFSFDPSIASSNACFIFFNFV